MDLNAQQKKELIENVVKSFYIKATSDFLIGYHFRKIQEKESDNPLAPPIESFKSHLPRINDFWKLQLLGLRPKEFEAFDLIAIHKQLNVLPGELGRWILLFKQTLKEFETSQNKDFLKVWEDKVNHFEKKFHDLVLPHKPSQ